MPKNKKTVVFLAAGIGSRLSPLTDKLPKCLVPVNGRSMLDYNLSALQSVECANQVESIVVVTGYLSEKLEKHLELEPKIKIIVNREYSTTNNMYSLSLFLTEHYSGGDVIIINADCIYEEMVLRRALSLNDDAILCDAAAEYNAEAMKILMSEDYVRQISKTIKNGANTTVSIDMYHLTEHSVIRLSDIVKGYIQHGEVNLWTEVALDKLLADANSAFRAEDISGLYWYEIDNHQDLESASIKMPPGMLKQ